MSPRTWKDHQRSLVTRKFEASSILAVDPSLSIISAVAIFWNTVLFKSGRISWLPVSQAMSIGTMWMLGYAVCGKSRRNGVETSGFRSPLLGIKAFRTAQSSHFHSSKHQAKKKGEDSNRPAAHAFLLWHQALFSNAQIFQVHLRLFQHLADACAHLPATRLRHREAGATIGFDEMLPPKGGKNNTKVYSL